METLVGVGGWAYLPIKRGNKLEICSKLYDFVEVNSTFYKLPEIERAVKWRKTVPDNFEFTLRANRELTHVGHLEPTNKNFKVYENMLEIAKELRASILHFQFPPSLAVSKELVEKWRGFFQSVYSRKSAMKFAIEARNPQAQDSVVFEKLVRDYDIIPTGDASKNKVVASKDSRLVYTRVFGKGEHTKWSFGTQELRDITERVESVPALKRYVTFHNLTMYEDASRMKEVVKSGMDTKVPAIAPRGLDSFRKVIASGRVKYPLSKKDLIEEYGWKTFEIEGDLRVHVLDELKKLEERKYASVDEVVESLK